MASSSRPGKETRTVRVSSLGFQWCEAKRAFPPTYVEASLEKAKQPPPRHLQCDILKLSVAGAGPAFLVLALACAALGFGVAALSLIEAHSHLV
jgi:hypothetical protein